MVINSQDHGRYKYEPGVLECFSDIGSHDKGSNLQDSSIVKSQSLSKKELIGRQSYLPNYN